MGTAVKVAHAGIKLKNKVKRKKSKLERKLSKKIESMTDKEGKASKPSGHEYVLSKKVSYRRVKRHELELDLDERLSHFLSLYLSKNQQNHPHKGSSTAYPPLRPAAIAQEES